VMPKEGLAIQVCHTLSSENQEREVSGLLDAMQTLRHESGMILTYDREGNNQRQPKDRNQARLEMGTGGR
jgi:hypothetical protein